MRRIKIVLSGLPILVRELSSWGFAHMSNIKARSSLRRLRALRAGSLMLLGLMVVFQYQNCAPAGNGTSANGSATGSPVSIIDKNDVQGLDVSFAQKQVTIQSSTETVDLDGICSSQQDGSVFQWKLTDSSSSQLDSGMITCKSGSFKVEINPTQALNCDQQYQVSAQLGLGQAGEVILTRKCQAAATMAVSSMQRTLASDTVQKVIQRHIANASVNATNASSAACVTEKRIGEGSGCAIACYSAAGVEAVREQLPTSACDL